MNTTQNPQNTVSETPPLPHHVDVVCIGGGLVGMTMACTLAKAGVSVMVVDNAPLNNQSSHHYDGRASAIAYGSIPLFQFLDIWDTLSLYANPIETIAVNNANSLAGLSPLGLHYDHRDLGDMPFGYVIENNRLRGVLLDKCQSLGDSLTYVSPANVTDITIQSDKATVTLDTGHDIKCSLILGCDGKFSKTRQRLGFKTTTIDYKQHAIVCTIHHQKSHNNKAIEQFMPNGPFAMLPMTDNRTNIVWSCLPQHSPLYMSLSDGDFHKEVAEKIGDWTGDFTINPLKFSYPFSLVHAHDYVAHRVALIGDSAHGLHAIAGQGFNLGLRDVASMAEIIVDAMRLGRDIGVLDTLAQYDNWRRFDILTLETITNGLNALFSNDSPPLKIARTTGMAFLNKAPIPKKLSMKHAMGLVGDRPRLLRGESL